jgi:hypothetical protein
VTSRLGGHRLARRAEPEGTDINSTDVSTGEVMSAVNDAASPSDSLPADPFEWMAYLNRGRGR